MINGKLIDYTITKNNETRQTVCDKIGITTTAMSYWINNKKDPGVSKLVKLCDYLNLSLDDVVIHENSTGGGILIEQSPLGAEELSILDTMKNLPEPEKKLILGLAKVVEMNYNATRANEKETHARLAQLEEHLTLNQRLRIRFFFTQKAGILQMPATRD